MNRCLVCDEGMKQALTWRSLLKQAEARAICARCEGKLNRITGETCTMCSRELGGVHITGDLCLDCSRWERNKEWSGYLSKNISLFHYNEYLKDIIAKYKYRGDYALAEVFVPFLKERLKDMEFDLVTVIPLSHERLTERGFNQVQALADLLGIHTVEILTRIHTEKQSKKSRQERISLPQVFQVMQLDLLEHKSILIIDDIYTTGTTLRHAAKALITAGAKEVSSITLAR
ncbi:amidophosphoribosyltransferase [Bacillus sp. BA3]|uniref:ComF family protein n=1 Tax=Bacillaceae TaxID=186817 RepID=UPI000C344B57|nr:MULTISPECIES: ComF family protein [Bacillaceae]MCT4479551.1 ComF family protein [Peribacillus frigoritolerans]PKF88273.1 amidophosphoribosyltransferase [Bacillus sp. BA3]